MSVDVIRSVRWVREKQLVVDLPGFEVSLIVDEQREAGHVGDVDKRVATFVSNSAVTNIDCECDEQ